jgi:cation diffusion facilitator family transporter
MLTPLIRSPSGVSMTDQPDPEDVGEDPSAASTRTVLIAVLTNVLVALAKAVAAVLTGSAAMAAETAHSVADTSNEILLYIGVRRGKQPPDDRHPFGYGQARYFWSLLAAVGVFVIGGLLAIYQGVNALRHPEPLTDLPVGIAVVLVSAVLEGVSWRTARRELRDEADARHLSLADHVATSSNPTPTTVFFEDTAALIGLALALAALVLHATTGSAVPDGIASLLIGVLLIIASLLLVRRNAALLIDESAPVDVRDRLTRAVAEEPWVAEVADLTAVRIGPNQLLVIVHVVPAPGADLVPLIEDLRRRLVALPAISRVEITPVARA